MIHPNARLTRAPGHEAVPPKAGKLSEKDDMPPLRSRRTCSSAIERAALGRSSSPAKEDAPFAIDLIYYTWPAPSPQFGPRPVPDDRRPVRRIPSLLAPLAPHRQDLDCIGRRSAGLARSIPVLIEHGAN